MLANHATKIPSSGLPAAYHTDRDDLNSIEIRSWISMHIHPRLQTTDIFSFTKCCWSNCWICLQIVYFRWCIYYGEHLQGQIVLNIYEMRVAIIMCQRHFHPISSTWIYINYQLDTTCNVFARYELCQDLSYPISFHPFMGSFIISHAMTFRDCNDHVKLTHISIKCH